MPASLTNSKVRSAVSRRLKAALKDFPGYAKIRQVHLSLEPWSVEEGLMTPTLKMKRPKVLDAFCRAGRGHVPRRAHQLSGGGLFRRDNEVSGVAPPPFLG